MPTTTPPQDNVLFVASATTRQPTWAALLVIGYAAVLVVFLSPIAVTDIPPLVDYPSHLARMHILSTLDSNATLAEIYASSWTVLPNLAMEMVILPLTGFLSVETAGRVFIALTMILLVGGTAALHRVIHGTTSLWPALSALFLYNLAFFWGFVGYLFAVGVFFLMFAGWIATAHWKPWARVVLFSLGATIIFMCHLVAFGIYGICVVAYELQRCRKDVVMRAGALVRFWAPTMLQFAIPAALWLMAPTKDEDAPIVYGALVQKLAALMSPILFSDDWIDRLAFIAVSALVVRGLFSRTLIVADGLKYPLIALCVVAVLIPSEIFSTWGADLRLPTVICCLFVAGTTLRLSNKRLGVAIVGALMAVFIVRTVLIADKWQDYDRQFAEFRAATGAIPEGSSLILAFSGDMEQGLDAKSYWHMVSLAVIDRSAFVPTLFTNPTQQPIYVKPPHAANDVPLLSPFELDFLIENVTPGKADRWAKVGLTKNINRIWVNWHRRFDYLLILHTGHLDNPLPRILERTAGGSFFDIYRIKTQSASAVGSL